MFESFGDFLTRFNAEADKADQLPVQVAGYGLREDEYQGEFIDWTYQYLTKKNCPSLLKTSIIRLTLQRLDSVIAAAKQQQTATNGGGGDEVDNGLENPLRLMQMVIHELIDTVSDLAKDSNRIEAETQLGSSYAPQFAVAAVKNSRKKMEDRHVVIDDFNRLFGLPDPEPTSFYAIFDGHGGAHAAQYAVGHFAQYLAASAKLGAGKIDDAMRDAFATVDANYAEKSVIENLSSGTTALCVVYRANERKLFVGWLGDSQALLVKQGKLWQIVDKHSPEKEAEKRRIEELGGIVVNYAGSFRVNGQLAVARAIGPASYKPYISNKPDISCIELDGEEDFLVMACDGLWDHATEDEIAMAVYRRVSERHEDIGDVGTHLVELAKQKGSSDNITAIVIFLKAPKAIAESAWLKQMLAEQDEKKAAELQQQEAAAATAIEATAIEAAAMVLSEGEQVSPLQADSNRAEISGSCVVVDDSGCDSEDEWDYIKGGANAGQKIEVKEDSPIEEKADNEKLIDFGDGQEVQEEKVDISAKLIDFGESKIENQVLAAFESNGIEANTNPFAEAIAKAEEPSAPVQELVFEPESPPIQQQAVKEEEPKHEEEVKEEPVVQTNGLNPFVVENLVDQIPEKPFEAAEEEPVIVLSPCNVLAPAVQELHLDSSPETIEVLDSPQKVIEPVPEVVEEEKVQMEKEKTPEPVVVEEPKPVQTEELLVEEPKMESKEELVPAASPQVEAKSPEPTPVLAPEPIVEEVKVKPVEVAVKSPDGVKKAAPAKRAVAATTRPTAKVAPIKTPPKAAESTVPKPAAKRPISATAKITAKPLTSPSAPRAKPITSPTSAAAPKAAPKKIEPPKPRVGATRPPSAPKAATAAPPTTNGVAKRVPLSMRPAATKTAAVGAKPAAPRTTTTAAKPREPLAKTTIAARKPAEVKPAAPRTVTSARAAPAPRTTTTAASRPRPASATTAATAKVPPARPALTKTGAANSLAAKKADPKAKPIGVKKPATTTTTKKTPEPVVVTAPPPPAAAADEPTLIDLDEEEKAAPAIEQPMAEPIASN